MQASQSNLNIGWANRSVTPEQPVVLGAQHKMRISEGVDGPVTVTALALSAGASADEAVIFVSCDLGSFRHYWYEQVVVNLACPSQETEHGMKISADFWHEVRTEIRKRHGEPVQVLAQCAAAGDQSPHRLWYKAAEERMLTLRGLTMRQEIGRRVANAVDDVLPAARKDIRTGVPLKHLVRTIHLPRRMVTEEEVAAVRQDLSKLETEAASGVNNYRLLRPCRRVLERYEDQKESPSIPMTLHVVRLDDIAFASNRFELFLDFGIRIKARSPAVQTFVIQLAANVGWTGNYLPSERAVANLGYGSSVYNSEIGPEGGQVIVEETVKTLNALWPAESA